MKENRRFQRFAYWLDLQLVSLLAKREVIGLEHLSSEGPYIFVVNHLSKLDVPLAYSVIGCYKVTGWAAEKWERHVIFGRVLKWGEAVFIRRGEIDRDAIAAAVSWMDQGNLFGIAPEGTRSDTHTLQRGKTGVAYLANEARLPVVPIAIYGTERAHLYWIRLRRAPMAVRIGPPVLLPPIDEGDRTAGLRQNTDEIMCQLAALLPPSYRGYYAEHPRLLEILAERGES
jgi:1-acyl-sn-glycerol-3-phosphate acyltransferase